MTPITTPSLPQVADFPATTPPALVLAVQQLYAAFAHRVRPQAFNACTCGLCMPPAMRTVLQTGPLHRMAVDVLAQYLNAARDASSPALDFAWLLPRVAELMSHGDLAQMRHSAELALDRLAECPAGELTEAEHRVLNAWLMLLWRWYLQDGTTDWPCPVPMLSKDADELLLMAALAGLPLAPLLGAWLQVDSDWAVLQFALLAHALDVNDLNPFVEDRQGVVAELHAWTRDAHVRQHFRARWLAMSPDQASALLNHDHHPVTQLQSVLGERSDWPPSTEREPLT